MKAMILHIQWNQWKGERDNTAHSSMELMERKGDDTAHSSMESMKRELLNAAKEGRNAEVIQLIQKGVDVETRRSLVCSK